MIFRIFIIELKQKVNEVTSVDRLEKELTKVKEELSIQQVSFVEFVPPIHIGDIYLFSVYLV